MLTEVSPPTDNGEPIPGIEDWARPVVILNPAPGSPAVADSHIGGPMLWPADEPWPWCDGTTHSAYVHVKAEDCEDVAVPFVGAVQLYRRDFPELPFPDGTDLLQVLLCPLHHRENGGPGMRFRWRAPPRSVR